MSSNEQSLIDRIRGRLPSSPNSFLREGIGDDAAVLQLRRGTEWVVSCDQFIDGVHFLSAAHPPEVVGYKALARATSDLAAMGSRPRVFLMSLAIPRRRTGKWLGRMLAGMASAARSFGLTLAGGDTTRSPQVGFGAGIALSLTVLGEVERGRAILRRGAKPGDALFVSGQLGAAQLGLEIVLRGLDRQARWKKLLAAHNHPRPAIEIGQWLAHRRIASAMIDLSDGLSTDLRRLCQASHVSARIVEKSLPRVSLPQELQARGIRAAALALHGGEDYGLLFAVPKAKASRVPQRLGDIALTRIGEILRPGRTPDVELVLADGSVTPLLPLGWDPFAGGRRTKKR